MGALEPEFESGITQMNDNDPTTIAATLQQVIRDRRYEQTAVQAALKTYGPEAVARGLDELLNKIMTAARESRKLHGSRKVAQASRVSPGIQATH
jgi:hypothetical protein